MFCGDGGGSGNGELRIGGDPCTDADQRVIEWEGIFLVAFVSDIGGSKYIRCQWTPL